MPTSELLGIEDSTSNGRGTSKSLARLVLTQAIASEERLTSRVRGDLLAIEGMDRNSRTNSPRVASARATSSPIIRSTNSSLAGLDPERAGS